MAISAWLRFFGSIPLVVRSQLTALLERAGIATGPASPEAHGLGIAIFDRPDETVLAELRELTRASGDIDLQVVRAEKVSVPDDGAVLTSFGTKGPNLGNIHLGDTVSFEFEANGLDWK